MIKLDSVYSSHSTYYLVFELFSGGNLKDYVKKNGVFTERQASYIIRELLEAIKYIHNLNIMHRDIKPDNILFRSDNIYEPSQIALADFGLATFINVSEYIHLRCGTPGFIAPEVFSAVSPTDHYSSICDLYSLGVTLFFMLFGHLPYNDKKDLIKENRNCSFNFYTIPNFISLSECSNAIIKYSFIILIFKKPRIFSKN